MTTDYPFAISGDEFKGKRVLVTGGTKGMGAATVRRFQLSGAVVATTARSDLPRELAPDLFIQADLGTAAGAQKVVDRIKQEWDGLDILVDNVGGGETKPGGFEALSDEEWLGVLNLNLLAAVRLDRAFVPGMMARGSGVVVHISSVSHLLPFPNFDDRLCRGQGCAADLQQGLVEERRGTGRAGRHDLAGFIETSGAHGMIMEIAQIEGIDEDAGAAAHRRYAGRHPARPPRPAGGGDGTGRLPRLGSGRLHHGHRLCPGWRHYPHRLTTAGRSLTPARAASARP